MGTALGFVVGVFLGHVQREFGLWDSYLFTFKFLAQAFDIRAQAINAVSQADLLIFKLALLFVQPHTLVARIAQGDGFDGDRLLHAQQLAGAKILDQQSTADADHRYDPPIHDIPFERAKGIKRELLKIIGSKI